MDQWTNIEQWKALYDQAIRVRNEKPWELFDIDQLFAIEDPITKMNYYCFIYSDTYSDSVRVLLGEEAVTRFLESMDMDPYEPVDEVLDLQAYLTPFDE